MVCKALQGQLCTSEKVINGRDAVGSWGTSVIMAILLPYNMRDMPPELLVFLH